ncbi:CRISPR-associated HD domain protein [uncultured Desulfobacterium sp.]|uniref:CRISPR-associated HD domain protein n=1 Tax=uncultured Desulfobacterium sp. TaxID=201089 RepID=A0A445MVQ9_9BACT|nr:CRISPR-associated HD domain protein [uncultured Desulfobacterium sp.]
MERNVLLAHSARFGYPEQTYKEHISEVIRKACESASKVAPYTPFGELFSSVVRAAAEYHDLGKLDEANQEVLRGKTSKPLPLDHSDGGTAYLLGKKSIPAALCVLSHHAGLPSIPEEKSKVHPFRINVHVKNDEKTVREITEIKLARYISKHSAEMEFIPDLLERGAPGKTFLRFALSCLVDADHADTARHYGRGIDVDKMSLNAKERLHLLDIYVNSLRPKDVTPERLSIRREFYKACREGPTSRGLNSCSMPVGTGKTTSVMAHLLMSALHFNLRKIFIVLPFTNIIDQSVRTYRQSLVVPGESPESVVAAHHHRAEYENPLLMAASFLWDAPITVTTAVQFFETLAANRPVALRKLHNLAGSAIFIDEAHAALPAHLWPQAWKWLEDLVQNWGCHIVLGSGTLAHFWKLQEFSETEVMVPEISGGSLYQKASGLEDRRIVYPPIIKEPMGIDDLCKWIISLPGPRIVVMNTVQSAAALANNINEAQGRNAVEHLSTAIAPVHRRDTLDRVTVRLNDSKDDGSWTLVATTCAEAGLNFSFRSAARELSSLASLIQIGGRVNRECEKGTDCQVWSFQIREDELLRKHPQFSTSAKVLQQIFDENKVGPDFCTEAMMREVREKNSVMAKDDLIVRAEKQGKYPDVANLFKVIDEGETFTVIIDSDFKERLESGGKPTRQEMQNLTVKMRKMHIANLGLPKVKVGFPRVKGYDELFFCPPEFYDSFLGYMRGVLKILLLSPEDCIA